MFVLAILLNSIATVIEMVLQIVLFIVAIRIVIGWFSPDPYNPLVQSLYRITEPMLRPFRRLTRSLNSTGIDFSPVLLAIVIVFIQSSVSPLLRELAARIRVAG